jgi:hypothetical protein
MSTETQREPGSDDEQEDRPAPANPFANAPIVAAPTGAAAQALIHREVAEVQGAMVIAKAHPRDAKAAVDRIMNSCARNTLAEAAMYSFSRGGTEITGPSIRLAEELARQWGNMLAGVTELVRGASSSECLAYAWDLETNFRDEKRFTVRHWRDTRTGGYALTDERDIYETIANFGARRKRACILAIIPGDVVEVAIHQCEVTLATKGTVTPERISNMVAELAKFNVTKEAIEKRLQRRVDTITAAQMVTMGKILNSLKDGMSHPGDWFEMPEVAGDTAGSGPKSATQSVKDKLASRQGGKS